MLSVFALLFISLVAGEANPDDFCQVGQFLDGGTCSICPKGHMCPYGAITPTKCPLKTYQDEEGQGFCKECLSDSDDIETGQTTCIGLSSRGGDHLEAYATTYPEVISVQVGGGEVTIQYDDSIIGHGCPTGTYTPSGSHQCMPIPPNYMKTSTSNNIQICPLGKYSFNGLTCEVCPGGFICNPALPYPYDYALCKPGTMSDGTGYGCKPCPVGKYCVEGKEMPVTSGHFVPDPPVQPIACPAGSFCVGGVRKLCPPGQSSGPASTSCSLCAKGKYSPTSGASDCQSCPVGFYQDETGQSSCKICPKGYYCSSAKLTTPRSCAEGTYAPFEGMSSCLSCPAGYECSNKYEPGMCKVGTYSTGGLDACTTCPANQSCLSVTTTAGCPAGAISFPGESYCHFPPSGWMKNGNSFSKCTQGKYCVNGVVKGSCKGGYYCPAGSENERQEICKPGNRCTSGTSASCGFQYQDEPGQSGCKTVPDGFRIARNDIDPYSFFENSLCPAGFYCTGNVRTTCLKGTYNPFRGATATGDCIPSPPGYFADGGNTVPEDGEFVGTKVCPQGHYCPLGSEASTQCQAGTYNPFPRISSEEGCLTCPIGFYCGAQTIVPTPCPEGTYGRAPGLKTPSDCRACEPGFFCPVNGLVLYDKYRCPPGHFCPRGSKRPMACPAGTFNPIENAAQQSDCLICPGGIKCAEGTTETVVTTEAAGIPGTIDSKRPTVCGTGEYCPPGTGDATTLLCPSGTYNNMSGRTSIDDCLPCTAGYTCKSGTNIPSELCPVDHYCPAGTRSDSPIPCPAGTHTNGGKGKTTLLSCIPVEPGKYKMVYGKIEDCPPGTYSFFPGAVSSSNFVGRKPEIQCNVCEPGYFCKKATHRERCKAGEYSSAGMSSCKTCRTGFYCVDSESGAGVSEDNMYMKYRCPKGLFCGPGMSTVPSHSENSCKYGYYCPEATSAELPIPPGYYSTLKALTGLSDLIICPAGYYCPGGASGLTSSSPNFDIKNILMPCDVNHFCPQGSSSGTQNKCPIGTYNPSVGAPSSSYCSACPAGFYCDGEIHDGLLYKKCSIGYYCPSGAIVEEPCPPGTYVFEEDVTGNISGLAVAEQCRKCPEGRYCNTYAKSTTKCTISECDPLRDFPKCHAGFLCKEGSTVPTPRDGVTGDVCPIGGYCKEGAAEPTPCSDGKYNYVEGGVDETSCSDCPGGFYCNGDKYEKVLCPAGFFCSPGTAYPFGSSKCVEGEEEEEEESIKCAVKCTKGFKCPLGSVDPIPCPEGTYSTEGASECIKCEDGSYCPEPATSKTTACPAGYYCDSSGDKPIPCKAGTYSNSENAASPSVCMQCTPGQYCSTDGLTEPTGSCLAGYRCTGGNTSPAPVEGGKAVVCERHHYCVGGSSKGVICSDGTYNSLPGDETGSGNDGVVTRTGADSCLPCPPGKTCTKVTNGGDVTMSIKECIEGSYCREGAALGSDGKLDSSKTNSGAECGVGTYCPEGSIVALPCKDGEYCDSGGLSEGKICTAGHMCLTGTQDPSVECPSGAYCPEGTGFMTRQCPVGSYRSLRGGKELTDCLSCPERYYCPMKGSSAGITNVCYPGFVCNGGCIDGKCETIFSTDGTTVTSGDNLCPVGKYCPNIKGGDSTGDKLDPIVCTSGTFRPYQGGKSEEDCYKCEYSFTCNNGERTKCTDGFSCEAGSSAPTTCVKGKYCEIGFGPYLCKPGTYTLSEGSSECIACDEGGYCNPYLNTTPEIDNLKPKVCSKGYTCPQSTDDPELSPCLPGTYSTSIVLRSPNECTTCDAGNFCHIEGADATQGTCNDGFLCPAGSTNPTPTLCPSGYYCKLNSSHLCDEGKFCSGEGYIDVSGDCGAGFYCEAGSQNPTPTDGNGGNLCPEGHYCGKGTTPGAPKAPIACYLSDWTYSEGLFQLYQCSGCPGGYECETGVGSTNISPCSPGFYCPPHKLYVVTATGDKMTAETFMEYLATNMGSGHNDSISLALNNRITCPVGHYCPEEIQIQIRCPPGSYQDETGKSECKMCDKGKYSDFGATQCFECKKGYYCPERDVLGVFKTTDMIPCPIGTFDNTGGLKEEGECTTCSGGHYCPFEGMTLPLRCPSGYFCPTGCSSYEAFLCGAGNYCEPGSVSETPCPAGKFSPEEGLQKEDQCIPCPPGFTCPYDAMTAPGPECPGGYYCEGGVSEVTESLATSTGTYQKCPIGHYCPTGSYKPTPCEPGTINNELGQTECPILVAGKYQDEIAKNEGKECPIGYYCPENTDYYFNFKCEPGTYGGSLSSVDVSGCLSCTVGNYCSDFAATGVKGECSAGYICQGGADSYTPGDFFINPTSENGLCQPGYYCEQGATAMKPCPEGTFNPFYGASSRGDCIKCPAGMYCHSEGMSLVDSVSIPSTGILMEFYLAKLKDFFDDTLLCSSGYKCPEGSINFNGTDVSVATKCLEGTYCPEGSTSEKYCLPGYYQNRPEQDTCNVCDFGNYCDAIGMDHVNVCGAGHFCDRDGMTAPLPCPAGTDSISENLTGMEQCLECKPGEFCPFLGQVSSDISRFDSYLCDAGYYCNTGSPVRNPGPSNLLSLVWNRTGREVTNVLDAGPCPAGYFCLEGNSSPTECPTGTFNVGEYGTSQDNDCRPCEAGKYCGSKGLSSPTGKCSYGYFCSINTSVSKPQNSVTFTGGTSAQLGVFEMALNSKILDTDYKKTVTQGKCPKGHKCSTGSIEPIPCDPGFVAAESSKACKLSPEGSYTSYYGLEGQETIGCNMFDRSYCLSGSIHPDTCPSGSQLGSQSLLTTEASAFDAYLVQLGAKQKSKSCVDCRDGYYCYADSSGECRSGYYCDGGTAEHYFGTETNKCPEGYYCVEGSSNPSSCRQGTYSTEKGLESPKECLFCQGGNYCQEQATTTQLACPIGFNCGIVTSLKDFPDEESSIKQRPCPDNYYCPPGSSTPTGCPAGYIGINTSVDIGETTDISSGTRSLDFKSKEAINVTKSNISPRVEGIDIDVYVPTGCKLTPSGSFNQVRAGSGTVCPDTSYCPEGSLIPTECPFGTWIQRVKGETHKSKDDCNTCPEGKWCRGGITVGSCVGGYMCYGSSDVSRPGDEISGISDSDSLNNGLGIGKLCEKNFYCVPGSKTQVACPEGKYTASEGSWIESQCQDCPAGYVCNGDLVDSKAGVEEYDTIPFPCPLGYYCPRLTGPVKCPIGTFGSEIQGKTISVCHSCPTGFYCPIEGIPLIKLENGEPEIETVYICPKNHFCPEGSEAPYLCPGGTYRIQQGGKNVDECSVCPPGYYCANSEDKSDEDEDILPKKCPLNYFCPSGTEIPILCPIGTLMIEGTVYDHISLLSTCLPCPPGMYCTYESNYLENEEEGGEENESGLEMKIVPKPCQAGYICTGGSFVPNPTDEISGGYICPYGQFCGSGFIVPKNCPPGTYNNELGVGEIYGCKKCPTNSYGREEGQRYCTLCGASAFTSPYKVVTTTGFIVVDNEMIDVYYDDINGNTDCYCIGHNRVFQYSDNMCVCFNSFTTVSGTQGSILTNYDHVTKEEYLLLLKGNNDDSKSDCIPVDHVACTSRMLDGTCIDFVNKREVTLIPQEEKEQHSSGSWNSVLSMRSAGEDNYITTDSVCEGKCGSVGGYFDQICECHDVEPNDICIGACAITPSTIKINKTNSITISMKDELIIPTFSLPIDGLNIVVGDQCQEECKGHLIRVNQDGFIGFADFNYCSGDCPEVSISGLDIVDEGMQSVKIKDPLVRIKSGDSIVFEIIDGHIPEYTTASRFNNDSSYDTGPFRKLKQLMFSGSQIRYFIQTFNSKGTFTFNDVVNKSHVLIIDVVERSLNDRNITTFLPGTVANLRKFKQMIEDDVMLEFDVVHAVYGLLLVVVICATVIGYIYFDEAIRLRIAALPRPQYDPIENNTTKRPLNIIKLLGEIPHRLFPVSKRLANKAKQPTPKSKYAKAVHEACTVYMRYQKNGMGEVMGPGRISLLLDRQEEILRNMEVKPNIPTSTKEEAEVETTPNIQQTRYDPRRKYDSSLFYDVCSVVPEFSAAHLYSVIDDNTAALGEHVDATNEKLESLFEKLNKRVEEIKNSVLEKRSQILQSSLDITNSELSKKEQRIANTNQRKDRADMADRIVVTSIKNIEAEQERRTKFNSSIIELLNKIVCTNNSNYIILNDILDNPQNESEYRVLENNIDYLASVVTDVRMKLSDNQKEEGLRLDKIAEYMKVAGRLIGTNGSIVSESSLAMEVKGETKQTNTICIVPGLFHPDPKLKIVTAHNQSKPEPLASSYFNYFITSTGKLFTTFNKVFIFRNTGAIITLPDIINNILKDKNPQILDERDFIPFVPTNPRVPIPIPQDNSSVFSRMRQRIVTDTRTGLCVPTECATFKISDNDASVVAVGGVMSDPVSGLLAPQQMTQLVNVSPPHSLLCEPLLPTQNNRISMFGLTSGIVVTEQGQSKPISSCNGMGQPITQWAREIDTETEVTTNVAGVYDVKASLLQVMAPSALEGMIEKITAKNTSFARESLMEKSFPVSFGSGIGLANLAAKWRQIENIVDDVEENIKRISIFRISVEGANEDLSKALKKSGGEMDKVAAEYEAMEVFQNKVNRASIELTNGGRSQEGSSSTNGVIIKLTLAVENMIKKFIEQQVIFSRPLCSVLEKLRWEHKMLSYTKETGNACSTAHPITFPPFDIPSGASGDILAENAEDLAVQPYIIPTPSFEAVNSHRAYISAQSNIRSHYFEDVQNLHKTISELKTLLYNVLRYNHSPGASTTHMSNDIASEAIRGDIADLKGRMELLLEIYKKLFEKEMTRRKLEAEHVGQENLLSVICCATFDQDQMMFNLQSEVVQSLRSGIEATEKILANLEETDEFFSSQNQNAGGKKQNKAKTEDNLVNEYQGILTTLKESFSETLASAANFESLTIEAKATYSEMSELLALKRDVLRANRDIAEKAGSGSSLFAQKGAGPTAQTDGLTAALASLLKGVDQGRPKFLADVLNTKLEVEDEAEAAIEKELANANAEVIQGLRPSESLQDITLLPFGQLSQLTNNPASVALALANSSVLDNLVAPQAGHQGGADSQYAPPESIIASDSLMAVQHMDPEELKTALINKGVLSEEDEMDERAFIDEAKLEIENDIAASHTQQLQLLMERDNSGESEAIKDNLVKAQSISQDIAKESLNKLINASLLGKLQENKNEGEIKEAKKKLEVLQSEVANLAQQEIDEVARVRAEAAKEQEQETKKIEDSINKAKAAEKERLLTQQGIERGILSQKLEAGNVPEEVRRSEFRKLSDVHKGQMETMEARIEADETKQRELLKKMLENKRRRREAEVKYTFQERRTQNAVEQNMVKSDLLALDAMVQDTSELKAMEKRTMETLVEQLKTNERRLISKLETAKDPEVQQKIVEAYADEVKGIEKRVETEKIKQMNELRAKIANRREKIRASKQVGEGQLVISNNERKTQLEKDVAMFDNEEKDAKANLNLVSQMREKRTESVEKIAELLRTSGTGQQGLGRAGSSMTLGRPESRGPMGGDNDSRSRRIEDNDDRVRGGDNQDEDDRPQVVLDLDIDTSSQTGLIMSCERAMDALDGKLNSEYDRQRDNLRKMIETRKRNQLKRIAQNEMNRKTENEEIVEDINERGEVLVSADDTSVITRSPAIVTAAAQASNDLRSQIAHILDIEKTKLERTPSHIAIKGQPSVVQPTLQQDQPVALSEPDVDAETEELRRKQEEEYRQEVERLNKEADAEMNRIKEEARRRKMELMHKQASAQGSPNESMVDGLMGTKAIEEMESLINDEIQSQQQAAKNMLETRKLERLKRLKAKQDQQLEEKRKILMAAKDEIETRKKQLAEKRAIGTILQTTGKQDEGRVSDIVFITLQERHRDEFTKMLIHQQEEENSLIRGKKAERMEQYKRRRDDVINVFNRRMEELAARKDSDLDVRKKQMRENHNKELRGLEELYGIGKAADNDSFERDDDVVATRMRHMNERKETFERQRNEIQEIIKDNAGNTDMLQYEEEISMRVLQMHNELEHQALERVKDDVVAEMETKDPFEVLEEGEEEEETDESSSLVLPSAAKISDQLKKFVPSTTQGSINAGMYQGPRPIDIKALKSGHESGPSMLGPLENESRIQLEFFKKKIEERRRLRNGGADAQAKPAVTEVDKDEEARELERQKRVKAEERLARIKEMERRKNEEILAKIREQKLKKEVLGASNLAQQTQQSSVQKEVLTASQKPLAVEPTVELSNKVASVEGNISKLVSEVKQIVNGDEVARRTVASKVSPPFIAQLDVLECQKDGVAPTSSLFDPSQVEQEVRSTTIDPSQLATIEQQALRGVCDLIAFMARSGYKNIRVEVSSRVPACRLHPYMRSYYYQHSNNTIYICRARLDIRSQARRDELATIVAHVLSHIRIGSWDEENAEFKKAFVNAISLMAAWKGAF